ncbi:hypothetical protein BU17DRAFT_66569 [Hysterangium stoloniferum]|nr:hypothetical protein BU17DRAFT_66569 [Hysterangium stoloniferum]
MIRIFTFCTTVFELFLITNALIGSTPRTHPPLLEKRIAGLLAVRSVSCGDGALRKEEGVVPLGGGGGIITLPNPDDITPTTPTPITPMPSSNTPTSTFNMPTPTFNTPTPTFNTPTPTPNTPTPTPNTLKPMSTRSAPPSTHTTHFGGVNSSAALMAAELEALLSPSVYLRLSPRIPLSFGGSISGLNPATTANSSSGSDADIGARSGGVTIGVSVWKVAVFALLSMPVFFL